MVQLLENHQYKIIVMLFTVNLVQKLVEVHSYT